MFKDENRHYSLRKLSVGLASVLIGISFASSMNVSSVKADTVSAQASAIETKTSENKVNTNVDASKDVAKSTNSVDSNKITPSQTVLNKQATSNDLFKGTSDQNSMAEQSQKNLLDDLGKQKASAENNQVEAKNQENRLVDQINYKLTNNTSTDPKEDLGQNLTAPDETKQAPTDKNDAEKSIVRSSSTQQANNQLNNRAEDNAQAQNEQKLDLTKNIKKFAKKMLATNLTKTQPQKDYTPDISAWTGHDDGTYYILDKYTPKNDAEKDLIVIPNEADFEKAGKSTNGHEVGIAGYNMRNIVLAYNPKEIHFSETDNKKIKAIYITNDYNEWHRIFQGDTNLKSITGNSFDTSSIINMEGMFIGDSSLSDISALASWDVGNVIEMSNAFAYCSSLSDLSPLEKWNTRSLQRMGHMFAFNPSLISIEPLRNWNLHNAQYQDNVFTDCTNLVDIDAINNWDYSSTVIVPGYGNYPLDDMFNGDRKIKINIGTDSGLADFIRRTGRIDAFHNSSNQITTSNTKLIELLTNTDFKGQNETTTAKRIITFSGLPANRAIPPIIQVINYTKLATAIIDMTGTSDSNAHGKIVSSSFEKDWQLDTSKQNDDVIIDGVINFKPVKIPHVYGYKAHLIKDPVNPTAFLVSFMAVPEQPQNNQSISNNDQSSQKEAQDEQNQPEPIQTRPANDKQIDQIIDHIAYTLMHNSSDTADNFEPTQNDSAPLETADVTQKVKPEPAKPSPIETQVPVGTHDSLNKYTLTTNDPLPDTLVFNNIESDQATGKTVWTPAKSQTMDAVSAPEITGYTPSQKTINAISVSHDSNDVNQIVIYTANTQKAVITYVDDTDGDIVACDKTAGRFGEMIKFDHNVDDRIKAFENQGYRLVSNNFDNQTYMANNEQNVFVVRLTHGKTNVQRDDIVTETIEYQFEDDQKAHDSMIQQIKFVQNGIQDSVTKSVVWTPNDPQQFENVTTPDIEGYTPNISQISAKTITFGDSDLNYVVKYIANMQNAKILYIDDNTGTLLKSDHTTGKFNTIIDFNINPITQISEYINSGYRLVSNNFNNQAYKTDNEQNRFTVHLAHNTQNVQRTKTLMRVIKYQYANGQKASDDVVQTSEFTQQGVKDLVNDKITWSQTSDHQFARVITPQIVGYCPDKKSIDTETISYDGHNQTIIVTYKAQELPAQLRIIDDTTGQVVAIDDANGKYHELIEFNDLQKQLQDLQKHGYQITSNTFNNQHYNVDKSQNLFEIHVIKHDNIKHDDVKHEDIKHDDIKHEDIKHEDIKHEDIKHDDIKHDDIKHEDIKHEDIKHEDIKHDDVKHEDIKHADIKHVDIKHEDSLIIRKAHKSEKTLPQTGADDTRTSSVIGAISSLIAGLSLVGVSRKKHKKND